MLLIISDKITLRPILGGSDRLPDSTVQDGSRRTAIDAEPEIATTFQLLTPAPFPEQDL